MSEAGSVLLAVSGGPDSTALMHAAARWAAPRPQLRLAVATVDHRLRPASGAEAEAVGEAARALGLDHRILPWELARSGPASQDRAREARYRLLVRHAREIGAERLVTAHTLDDQAETLLIRMAAGSGLSGLAGMRPLSHRQGLAHHRPFLVFSKARLVATCRAERWAFAEDPSNEDRRYARARWREFMPLLAAEGLDAPRLGRLAERLRRADEALNSGAEAALARCALRREGPVVFLAFDKLAAEPAEIALRVLTRAVSEAPSEASLPSCSRLRFPQIFDSTARVLPHPGCEGGLGEAEPGGGGSASATMDGPPPRLAPAARLGPPPKGEGRRAPPPAREGEAGRDLDEAMPPSEAGPLRLERVEACLAALLAARSGGRPLRRSLAGRILSLGRDGLLTIAPEPPRFRGRALTVSAARTPHSLGTKGPEA